MPCQGDSTNAANPGTNNGASCDPADDIETVVAAWPKLPQAIRAGIVAMVRATTTVENGERMP